MKSEASVLLDVVKIINNEHMYAETKVSEIKELLEPKPGPKFANEQLVVYADGSYVGYVKNNMKYYDKSAKEYTVEVDWILGKVFSKVRVNEKGENVTSPLESNLRKLI